ncbi:MAG: DUF2905 domain-containing protein [Nitrospiraceae bacterium]|nr:MAG: DUF2905 domain-containing protein [Nitrospiraceae bacterium]
MADLGKFLVITGLVIACIGAVLLFFRDGIPLLGKLPGDIVIRKKNFTFYFPLATSILLSIILSLIFYFFGRK